MIRNRDLWIIVVSVFVLVCQASAQSSPHGVLAMECTSCHVTSSWKEMKTPMDFNHSATSFPLTGQHTTTTCKQCHTTLRFAGTATDCFTCHREDFQKMKMPDHQRGQFSHDCTTCHSTNGYKPSIFDHRKTNFQLVGSHLAVDCFSCHQNSRFAGTPTDCYSCHRTEFATVTTPNHQLSQFSTDCTTCHTMNGWKPSTFDHAKTNFPLQGAHLTAECFTCHANSRFAGTPTDCFSCHQTDFSAAKVPDHLTGRFSKDCTTCHSLVGWKPSFFDHSKTSFQLVGAHMAVDCASCHAGGKFVGTPMDCYSCHQSDFTLVKTVDHQSAQFSHDCTTCHTLIGWKPATFDHSKTNFQLIGAHRTVDCVSCHTGGKFTGTPTVCYACHKTDFSHASNHLSAQFSHDCVTCHTVNGWTPSTFDHSRTIFSLQGAHQTVQCLSCHKNGQFTGLPTDCYSCHLSNYNSVQTPNHQLNLFSHDCLTCHTVNVWRPSTFNHASTSFPLTGAHQTTDCLFCHKNGQFKGLPSDCFSCHQNDFTKVTDPNHATGGFDHNCATCHSTSAWTPATFDHNKTNFKLTGAHVQTDCARCHVNNRFAGTSTDCYSCHQQDYSTATNPNHSTAKYPVTCATCHTTSVWQPATFDHTPFFPISAGSSHSPGRWTFCSDCHSNQSNPATFECINCHQHSQATTDSQHRNRTGYLYQSASCYKCHPQGR